MFWDEWLGNIDEMFADIGAFISEKITSKNYVANSNTVVDDKTGTSYTYNSDGTVTINQADGIRKIYNTNSGIAITLSNGINRVSNYGSNVKITGSASNDMIFSHEGTEKNSFTAGRGDDYIIAYDTHSTIHGDTGNDKISVLGDNNSIFGDADRDAILINPNYKYNTIRGGKGNDIIIVENAPYQTIVYDSDDGLDVIFGYDETDKLIINTDYVMTTGGGNVLITAGTGTSTLVSASGKTIDINSRKINTATESSAASTVPSFFVPDFWKASEWVTVVSASNSKSNVTLSGTSGADSLKNSGSSVLISGNDTIKSTGSNVTVNAGEGNNSVSLNSSYASTVIAGNGDDNVTIGYGYVSVGGGKNNVYLSDNSYYYYDSLPSTVISGDGDDTIDIASSHYSDSYNYKNLILAGGGNNYINNANRLQATITVGSGNDTIITGGYYSSINAGDGNNFITVSTSNGSNTILTGTGNDTISFTSGSNSNFIVLTGGNDIIQNYESGNTIKSVGIMTSTTTGDDIILTDGKNTITLEGARGKTVHTATISSAELIECGLDTVPSGGDDSDIPFDGLDSDTKQAVLSESLTTLKKIKALGAGTAQAQSNGNDNDFANKTLSSSNDIAKMLGKFFEEFTKWQRDSSGKLI